MHDHHTTLSRADGGRKTEIRFEVDADEVSVLDGYCQATGKDRTRVIRDMLKVWSHEKHIEAIMIVRVAGSNPTESELGRK